MTRLFTLIALLLTVTGMCAQSLPHDHEHEDGGSANATPVIEPSYAWRIVPPLGLRTDADIDTVFMNYAQEAVPSLVRSYASALTGNYGAETYNMLYFERRPASQFFFLDALEPYLPSVEGQKFYNTRIPMTLLGYNFGGVQDRLKGIFSGNINKMAQAGADMDYIYSKGSYPYQAMKNFSWGLNGSYLSPRYDVQAFFHHYFSLNKENGGITDDRYITDPAEIQGGSTSVNTQSIPTRLTGAHSEVQGTQLYATQRYKLGFTRSEYSEKDSIETEVFVPVSAISWTLDYRQDRHMFRDDAVADESFWANTYLTKGTTLDNTFRRSLRNTVGLSLLEGFNKYAKFGFSAFLTHEFARYYQTPDTLGVTDAVTENSVWIGGQLTKQQGSLLRYSATGSVGVVGASVGEVDLTGELTTRFRLRSDSVSITAYGSFTNKRVPYFLRHYASNHFMWDNDFGKTRRVRFGGRLYVAHTGTTLSAGVENVQNLVYFNAESLPVQHGGNVQVFSASLAQDFHVGILNWNNRITYQKSANEAVIPLPQLSVYSNLYLLFKVAGVFDVQLGVDCDYMTRYNAMGYQPATMSFYNQQEVKVGNYPYCNAFVNMKLSKVRFYVLMNHVNQGLFGGSDYFGAAHYPLNPRRLLLGLSVDFAN